MRRDLSRREFAGTTGGMLLGALGLDARPPSPEGVVVAREWIINDERLQVVPQWMEVGAVPGFAAVAIHEGKVNWTVSMGVADVRRDQPADEDSLFEVASLGKPVTAYIAFQLRDEGLLDLDRPLFDYVPDEDLLRGNARSVTVRQLMSHTAGFPNWRNAPGPLDPAEPPGSHFTYSGEGYFLLQRVIETVTDQPFEHVAQNRVFGPLGMDSSSFVWRAELEARFATGHLSLTRPQPTENFAVLGRRLHAIAAHWNHPLAEWRYPDMVRAVNEMDPAAAVLPTSMMPNAGGSLFSCASDFARFVLAMLGCVPNAPLGTRSLEEMLVPQIGLNSEMAWGLGWGLELTPDGEMFWQWGNNDVYRSFVVADPKQRRALLVLTNGSNGHKLYARLVREATGVDHPALMWFRT